MTYIDFGHDWLFADGRRGLLCWYRQSGELILHHPSGNPRKNIILAVVTDETEVRSKLDGWEHHTSNGFKWLAEQLEGCR